MKIKSAILLSIIAGSAYAGTVDQFAPNPIDVPIPSKNPLAGSPKLVGLPTPVKVHQDPKVSVIAFDAGDPVIPDKYKPGFTDADAAGDIIQDALETLTSGKITFAMCSTFAHVRCGKFDYIVAKVSVNSFAGIHDIGYAIELQTGEQATTTLPEYRQFLKTGDRSLFGFRDAMNALE
jgi:hypothetical protein